MGLISRLIDAMWMVLDQAREIPRKQEVLGRWMIGEAISSTFHGSGPFFRRLGPHSASGVWGLQPLVAARRSAAATCRLTPQRTATVTGQGAPTHNIPIHRTLIS